MQVLRLRLESHDPCDSPVGVLLNGELKVDQFVSAFIQHGGRRGVHAGNFVWMARGIQIEGRMSGVTNLGTHRRPVFDDCQPCNARGVMEGRLCGAVVRTRVRELRGAQIMAAYRIRFRASRAGIQGELGGVLEGSVLVRCR